MQPEISGGARSIIVAGIAIILSGATTVSGINHSNYIPSHFEKTPANAVAWCTITGPEEFDAGASTIKRAQVSSEVIQAALKLLQLPENWNSYGARSTNPRNVRYALELLNSLTRSNTPTPWLIPTSAGGVQIEWHTRGIDLEIRIDKSPIVAVLYEDVGTGEFWEGELSANLERLNGYVAQLSSRV